MKESDGSGLDNAASSNIHNSQIEAEATSASESAVRTDNKRPNEAEATRPNKRPRRKTINTAKPKRLKGLYNDDYRVLFNFAVTEAGAGLSDDLQYVTDSVIGVSRWTVAEKRAFFNALDRHGRDDIPKLAAAIQTKSGPEIREYLLLLQSSLVDHHRNAEHVKQQALHKCPAAVELSEECCENLDAAGEALAWYQDNYDAKQEHAKHGDYWLLTSDLSKKIEDCVEKAELEEDQSDDAAEDEGETLREPEGEIGESNERDQSETSKDIDNDAQDILNHVPSARILNLPNWLDLTYLFTSNSRTEEDLNPGTIPNEEPGIYHTAFEDFHRLTVSVTQRIVSVVLHQAMTRLRATDRVQSKSPKPFVKRQDVLAAVDILGMPRSSWDFWVKAPRHCGLQMYRSKGEKKKKVSLNYDEAEYELSQPQGKRPRKGESTISHRSLLNRDVRPVPEEPDSDDVSEMLSDGSNDTDDEEREQDPDTQQDEFAEAFDQKQNQQEEIKLWEMLGREPPSELIERDHVLPKKPRLGRKYDQDLVDWRENLDYKAPWERYGEPVEEEEFRAMDRLRRAREAQRRARLAKLRPLGEVANDSASLGMGLQESNKEKDKSEGQGHGSASSKGEETTEADDEVMGDEEAENGVDGRDSEDLFAARRTLLPRRAREAATTSISATPVLPVGDDSSGDDFRPSP